MMPAIRQETSITPLLSEKAIGRRVGEIADAISKDFATVTERNPLYLVAILKGAFIFTADLIRLIKVPCTVEFISASSYGAGTSSSGTVELSHSISVGNRHVLLVEDIVDTGLTMHRIVSELSTQKPASIGICTLLDKPSLRNYPVSISYTGFTVPDRFLVGYGMDHATRYRNLPFIGTLEP